MKRSLFLLAMSCLVLVLDSSPAYAEDAVPLTKRMQRAYEAYSSLQPYLWNDQSAEDPKSVKAVLRLATDLRDNFHDASDTSSDLASAPGFKAYLTVLEEALDESIYGLKEGDPQWALWRLRTVANHCQTCHTTYRTGWRFEDPTVKLDSLTSFERGEFFLATRQFEKAEAAFFNAALKPAEEQHSLSALRKWLVIYTRVNNNPAGARAKLEEFVTQSPKLYPYEEEEINSWLNSLRAWEKERPTKLNPLEGARRLLTKSLTNTSPLLVDVDQVAMLRASTLLHQALDEKRVSGSDRAEALYLLGLTYSKIPLFFINELPEIYLELSIREFPATKSARDSFALYRELVLAGFTGSGGTHLPGDVRLKIQELHDLAFGIKKFEPRI